MLSAMRVWVDLHFQAAANGFAYFCRKPISTLMTVLVIAMTLVLPALFWVVTDNLKQLSVGKQEGGHIVLYLKTPLSSTDEASLMARVRSTKGVADATLKTSAEGLQELQRQEGMQDVMRYLSENPLPAVIDVTPNTNTTNAEKAQQLYTTLKAYPGVEEAKLDFEWISRVQAMLVFLAKLAQGLLVLLSAAVVLIIGNTLRLVVHHRYEEIQVLKLIGANDAFILRPFLYIGIWYGLAGAIVAIFLVNAFVVSLSDVVDKLASVYQMHYSLSWLSLNQMLAILGLAISLGLLGAFLSVKRQLVAMEPFL